MPRFSCPLPKRSFVHIHIVPYWPKFGWTLGTVWDDRDIWWLERINSKLTPACSHNQSKIVIHWPLFKSPSLFDRRNLFVEQALSYWKGWISATQFLSNKMINEKTPIISKLGLHKMSKKPKSVCLFMQSTVRSESTKIAKVGILAVKLLKTWRQLTG